MLHHVLMKCSFNSPVRFTSCYVVELECKLVRQDGVQTVFSVGNCSRTLNLAHLDSFQSEALDEAKQCQGEHDGEALTSYILL